MTVEEAARQTWAYERASSKGYSTVAVIDVDGTAGSFRSIDVVFLP
jgi:hypothetical protein